MDKVVVHIAVMDYSLNQIRLYDVEMDSNWNDSDVELWLRTNTANFKDDTCYFMCSSREITIWK